MCERIQGSFFLSELKGKDFKENILHYTLLLLAWNVDVMTQDGAAILALCGQKPDTKTGRAGSWSCLDPLLGTCAWWQVLAIVSSMRDSVRSPVLFWGRMFLHPKTMSFILWEFQNVTYFMK